jgi:hypothetical protein
MRIPFITLVGASALALGGCAYGDMGLGLGYGDYGYGSPYYGYNYGPYGGYGAYPGYYGGFGYGSSYYGGYGYGSPFGWYDNFYYPGSGIYVYDTSRRPYAMTTTQRQYWSKRSPALRSSGTRVATATPNWSGFNRTTNYARQSAQLGQMQQRQTAREDRRIERQTARASRDTDNPRRRH